MKHLVLACGVMACVSCSPANPTLNRLDLQLGQYILIATPGGSCPSLNTSIGTLVTLSREGSDWVARPPSGSAGSVELRIHEKLDSLVAGVAVAGSIVGMGHEIRPAYASTGGSVSFAGPLTGGAAAVSAETVPGQLNAIAGAASGQVTFGDSANLAQSCAAADIVLRHPIPCELDGTVSCGT